MSADAADEVDAPSDEALRERARRYRREAREHHPEDDPAAGDGGSGGETASERFEAPADYLSEGFGPVVSLYVESRTGGRFVRFTDEEYRGIEAAMNHWLACYAHARDDGVHYDAMDPDYTVREAAKLLIDTHSARHAADVLMGFRG